MDISTLRLATDGDDFERTYWDLFIKDQFPSYETFWLKFVVPITNRSKNVHFKDNLELAKIGKSESDVCIGQFNYSILRHLIRCFEIRKVIDDSSWIDQFDLTLEGMTRLASCHDIACELLERLKNPTVYEAFTIESGKKVKAKLRKDDKNPLKLIKDYRNNLVHGRLPPSIVDGSRLCLPDIGKEFLYLDWRKTTDFHNLKLEEYKENFFHASSVLERAWNETAGYLENNWKNL
ncbi:MAG: hypothetical protein HZA35_01760 [Parcubacteria group bacterium]|nr:hypothetical protein [Parcubacteria group bacterium]